MPETLISIFFALVVVLLIWKVFKKVVGAIVVGGLLLAVLWLLGLV
ncbi:MAG TPA: hypothetical protein VI933_03975 [archaeon]|nr:hypothetical protein [archaeon]